MRLPSFVLEICNSPAFKYKDCCGHTYSGNIASYSRCLNDSKRLEEIAELSQLAATVAEVSAEEENEKIRRREEKKRTAKEKEKRKQMEVADRNYWPWRLLQQLLMTIQPPRSIIYTLINNSTRLFTLEALL